MVLRSVEQRKPDSFPASVSQEGLDVEKHSELRDGREPPHLTSISRVERGGEWLVQGNLRKPSVLGRHEKKRT